MKTLSSRIISFLMMCSFLIGLISFCPLTVSAEEIYYDVFAEYKGTSGITGYTLRILKINSDGTRFKGEMNDGSKPYDISGEISNKSLWGASSKGYNYNFAFSFSGKNFSLDYNDTAGEFDGYTGIGFWSWGHMKGTKGLFNRFRKIKEGAYLDDLFVQCRELSTTVYKGVNKDNNVKKKLKNALEEYNYTDIVAHNFNDDIDDNVSFVLAKCKVNDDLSICVVVIRGTDGAEWEGNMKVCPPDDNGDTDEYTFEENGDKTHYNFKTAALGVEEKLTEYLDEYGINNENTLVVITGHSRGGAVSNLLAKKLTDDNSFSPSVTAYTFASPNVDVYNDSMEHYGNIFNFCNYKDLIPYIPLVNDNWNYWKYGQTYVTDDIDITEDSDNDSINIVNTMAEDEYAPNLQEYYNKKFVNENGEAINLYNFMVDCLAKPMSKYSGLKKLIKSHDEIESFIVYKGMGDLCNEFSSHLLCFLHHLPSKYKEIERNQYINTTYEELGAHLSPFEAASQQTNDLYALPFTNEGGNSDVLYNTEETMKIRLFLQNTDSKNVTNADKLGWNVDDPSTWEGITFNDNGCVSKIDLEFKNLHGFINLNDFTSLIEVNLSSNYITSVSLENCTSLEYLDLSDNELTTVDLSGCAILKYLDLSVNELTNLDLSNNTGITNLQLYSCGLNNLDISMLANLVSLDCGFNNLSSLNIDNNDNLIELYCMMNYLDLTDSAITNMFNTVSARENSDVVYEPQYLPHNAVFDSAELQSIKDLAKANTSLELIDDNDELDIGMAQSYFVFEKIDGVYRVVGIDLSYENVSGELNCNSFRYLKELYCNNTKITSVTLTDCLDLEVLKCDNSEIAVLNLPSNAGDTTSKLYDVVCENNHFDINVFTDAVINNITSKENSNLNFAHQLLNADINTFNQNDYELLVDFFNQYNNGEKLGWDLSNPGYWDYVSWKYNQQDNTYHLYQVDFDFLRVSGRIDLSSTTDLDSYSFAGSTITTAVLPDSDVCTGAFYDCKRLEAVVLSDGTTSINDMAFKFCPALQAVYMPSTVTNIGNDVFTGTSNVTIAGENNSYAQTYATTNSISFEAGYFICGNAIVRENTENSFEYFYPVANVNASCSSDSAVQDAYSDRYGYFVVFGLNNGMYDFNISHQYGNTLTVSSTVQDTSIIISTPFSMINFDWCHDGYINAKDYALLKKRINNQETGINDIFFDINGDTVVDENDWMFANGFLTGSYVENDYYTQMAPMALSTMPADNYVLIAEGNENMNAGWD